MTRKEDGAWVLDVLEAAGVAPVTVTSGRAWALCPWHQKKDDPKSWATAFFVRLRGKRRDREGKPYDATGQAFCFTCGEGGPLRRVVAQALGVEEEKAREFIARRGGPRAGSKVEELTRRVVVARVERSGRRAAFRLPAEAIFEPLRSWVTPARAYAESRGISAEEVETFGLGYAVDGPKLGGRILLPWRDAAGVAVGYSARTFIDATPKYTTPDPEENADRTVMFGEHLWPARAERELVVVTEGALNALAARRVLPGAAVAALGGSNNFDGEQAKKLATFRRALILTDPDAAGEKAATALSLMIGRYAELHRARLPAGKDALDVWLSSPERLERELRRALSRVS